MRIIPALLILIALGFSLAAMDNSVLAQHHRSHDCDHVQSTADTLACFNRGHRNAQDNMADTYKLVAEAQEKAETRTRLGTAQQSWIAYRKAQCEWEAGLPDNSSLGRIYELACLTGLTNQRVDLLRAIHEREASDEPREFGAQPRWFNVLAHDSPDIFWRYGKTWQADMNCNQQENQIMSGFAPPSAAAPHGQIVIAIASSPQTGKPRISTLKLPLREPDELEISKNNAENSTEEAADTTVYLCNLKANLTVRSWPLPEQSPKLNNSGNGNEHNEQNDLPDSDSHVACRNYIHIQDERCDPVIISWDGQAYTAQREKTEK